MGILFISTQGKQSHSVIKLPNKLLSDTMSNDRVIIHIEPMDEVTSFSIGAPSNATFLRVKELIQVKTGVAVNRQMLFHKQGGDCWSDSSTLESQGFKEAAELGLMVIPLPAGTQIKITISVPGTPDELDLTVEDILTVWELKERICSLLNIGSNTFFAPQRLHLSHSHFFTEMHDNEKLYKYFVNEGSKVIAIYSSGL